MNQDDFELWLSSNELHLSLTEISTLMRHYDKDGQGHIDIESFVAGMRGNLAGRRKEIVEKAFRVAGGGGGHG